MLWKKEINPHITYNSKSENPIIKEIQIHYCGDIFINFTSAEQAEMFFDLFQDFPDSLRYEHSFKDKDRTLLRISQKDFFIIDFLKKIVKFDPSIQKILHDLCASLKIHPFFLIDLEYLKTLPASEAIAQAIEAQKVSHFELIWQLLNYYYEDSLLKKNPADYLVTSQVLYDLANAIFENNPHYKKAQNKCIDILMLIDINSEENSQYLQLAFHHALNSSHQEFTDMFFHQLCGKKLNDKKIENIHPNEKILFNLADHIKELTAENEKLKKIINQSQFFKPSSPNTMPSQETIMYQHNSKF